jgi:predicted Zn-dependent peptidase
VIPGNSLSFEGTAVSAEPDEPAWRHTSLGLRFRAGDLAEAIAEVRRALEAAAPEPPPPIGEIDDPEERLDRALRDALGIEPVPPSSSPITPVAVVAMGDLDEEEALRLLERAFSDLPPRRPLPPLDLRVKQPAARIALPGKAQSQIGYAVPVPSSPLAWRMLLYILTHDYEGRLGKELIARRGLLYHVASRYRSDGHTGWLSMATGVNPDKLDETRNLFFGLLEALREHPPTEAEVEEARQHLIGRRLTAPMSNEEISAAYAREWIERGRLLTDEEWEREVRAVTREEVLRIVPAFLSGVRGTVDVRQARD